MIFLFLLFLSDRQFYDESVRCMSLDSDCEYDTQQFIDTEQEDKDFLTEPLEPWTTWFREDSEMA